MCVCMRARVCVYTEGWEQQGEVSVDSKALLQISHGLGGFRGGLGIMALDCGAATQP